MGVVFILADRYSNDNWKQHKDGTGLGSPHSNFVNWIQYEVAHDCFLVFCYDKINANEKYRFDIKSMHEYIKKGKILPLQA